MTAQAGRDFLLKIWSQDLGGFQTIAGIRTRSMSFSGGQIEVTDSGSPDQWRELLSGGGVKSLSLTGQGIFKDADTDEILRSYVFSGLLAQCQIIIPDFGSFVGAFQVSALEYTGTYNREVTFEARLESGGEITFTAL